ncbi:hypothetical protein SPHINGO391_410033 [Sphingomonas aurantiaca]|uniref:Uncharacterized protein n=1 Tax=Sphingomonas aurantiaca TaxID=185949 RepID=A0A5E7YWT0_9SPHN|nr:hypothetical protein SPHINGO391_410033 [Sphingomonas aurantiaca]
MGPGFRRDDGGGVYACLSTAQRALERRQLPRHRQPHCTHHQTRINMTQLSPVGHRPDPRQILERPRGQQRPRDFPEIGARHSRGYRGGRWEDFFPPAFPFMRAGDSDRFRWQGR